MREERKINLTLRLWRLLGHCPLRLLHLLSDGLAWVAMHLVRYRRDVVAENLRISFPEKSDRERNEIARKFYHYLTDTILEAPKMMTWSEEEMRSHMVFERADRILRDCREGRDFTLYIGHYGQWEWIPSIALWLPGISCAQVYARLHDPVADHVILANRQAHGSRSVEMHETLRYVLAERQSGRRFGVGFVADQSPSSDQLNHFVTFLGREVPTHVGAEKITKRLRMNSYFLHLERPQRGRWVVRIIPMAEQPENLPDYELTERFYRRLEEMIRQEPAYYLWSHRRFKYAKGN